MSIMQFFWAIFTLFTPIMSYASGAGDDGFTVGFFHPILGFDHLLAMVSVGILSAQMGGRSLWSVPATFVLLMLVGGLLGLNDVTLISVELAIAISVLALGVVLTIDKSFPPSFAMLFVGFFAVFHGYAHGLEIPFLATPALYVLGFIIATTLLHIAGVSIGVVATKVSNGRQLLRYLGASIAGIGVHLLVLVNTK